MPAGAHDYYMPLFVGGTQVHGWAGTLNHVDACRQFWRQAYFGTKGWVMKIRLRKNVFVRHVGDESIVWCPRSGGAMVMKDARPFMGEIASEWRDELNIDSAIAKKFDSSLDEILADAREIFKELLSRGFVEATESSGSVETVSYHAVTTKSSSQSANALDDAQEPNDDLLVDDFCKRHGIPGGLHIDLTNACTERCVHCYVPQDQRNFLPYEMVEKVLHEFRSMNGFSVYLTGGEPMLHPDFEKICRLCVELNLNFLIFSNMTLCDKNRIAFLEEVAPQFINVSLYSMNAEEHDAVTCLLGSWQETMDALLACEKAGVHCRIATPLLKENKNAFPALKQFASGHRMHLVPSYDIIPRANHTCSNLNHACSAMELKHVLSKNKKIFDGGWDGKMPRPEDKVCGIGEERLYLDSKGNYYPCDCMHEYVLGNVKNQTFEEIWHGEKLNYLRSLKNKDFGKCASCEDRPWCKVCPAFNFNATGDLFKTIPAKCAVSGVIHEVYGGK